jgi:hypothetical protein
VNVLETAKIENFWVWFTKHGEAATSAEVIGRMQKINRGLVADFEGPDLSGKRLLVVSAQGEIRLFPTVMRVAAGAPLAKLPGWQIVAFRQPRLGNFALTFEHFRLATDMVMMQVKIDPKRRKVHLSLAIQNWQMDSTEKASAVKLLLENLLGEYTASLKIGEVMVQSWKGELAGDNWLPVVRLPSLIETTLGKE